MKGDGPTSRGSLPAVAPSLDPEGAAVPAGPDRRAFICGAVLAGSVVATGWPPFTARGEEADWSDGTGWSDGQGWRS